MIAADLAEIEHAVWAELRRDLDQRRDRRAITGVVSSDEARASR
jgi:hypothetical protein